MISQKPLRVGGSNLQGCLLISLSLSAVKKKQFKKFWYQNCQFLDDLTRTDSLPHVQPRTTHPPSCIRGGSRDPSPPENKKIIKPAVFKLHSPKPTYKLMYHPTSITQKIPPHQTSWGGSRGGSFPCVENIY